MKNYSTENLTQRKMYFEQSTLTGLSGYGIVKKINENYVIGCRYYSSGGTYEYRFAVGKIDENGILWGNEENKTTSNDRGSYAFDIIPLSETRTMIVYYTPAVTTDNQSIRGFLVSTSLSNLSCSYVSGSGDNYSLSPNNNDPEVLYYSSNTQPSHLVGVLDLLTEESGRVIIAYIKKYTDGYTYYSIETCVAAVSEDVITFGTVDTQSNNTTVKEYIKLCYMDGTNRFIVSWDNNDDDVYLYGYKNVLSSITYYDSDSIDGGNQVYNVSLIDIGNDDKIAGSCFDNLNSNKKITVFSAIFNGTTLTINDSDVLEYDVEDDGYGGQLCMIKNNLLITLWRNTSGESYIDLCYANIDQNSIESIATYECAGALSYTTNYRIFLLNDDEGTINDPYKFVFSVLIKLLST